MSTADPTAPPITADQLLGISTQLKLHGKRCELVAGELRIMSPTGNEHGAIANEIAYLLNVAVRQQKLGRVFIAEAGFLLRRDPDTVKAPDVAFVRQSRVDAVGPTKKYFPEAPTLAVEVVSPSDHAGEVRAKAHAWIDAGCAAVWVVWPESRSITDYRSLDDVRELTGDQTLEGGDVVPGFTVPVADLFAGLG